MIYQSNIFTLPVGNNNTIKYLHSKITTMKKYDNVDMKKELELGILNYTELSRKYNISRPTVRAYAKRLGLHRGNKVRFKIHTLNEDYFKSINTPNKAYVLGFICADGCNIRRGLQIGINAKDKDVLEFIKIELEASNPLRYIKPARKNWSPKYELRVHSKELSKDLTAVGCPPAKSNILQFPHFLADDLVPHWIRGYFDGDGSLVKHSSWRLSITAANKKFIEDLQTYINQRIPEPIKKYRNKYNGCYSLNTSKVLTVKSIINLMYTDISFAMSRKHESAQAFLIEKGG